MRWSGNRSARLCAAAVGSAGAALSAGLAIYLLARPEASTPLLRLLPFVTNPTTAATLPWLGWLPTFLHAYAFTILTWAAVGFRHAVPVGLFWFALEVICELSQIPGAPFFNLAGTFDPADIAAAALATSLAAAAALLIERQKITGDQAWVHLEH